MGCGVNPLRYTPGTHVRSAIVGLAVTRSSGHLRGRAADFVMESAAVVEAGARRTRPSRAHHGSLDAGVHGVRLTEARIVVLDNDTCRATIRAEKVERILTLDRWVRAEDWVS